MDDFDEHSRQLWAGKARAYERSFAALCGYTGSALVAAAGVGPGTRTLDVGCGTGGVSALAAELGAVVTASDADPGMVAHTAARLPDIRCVTAVLPQLPFPDATFDAVVANFVINHVARPLDTVRELVRVTVPRGRVAVTIWPQEAPPLQKLWDDVLREAEVVRPAQPGLPPGEDFARTPAGLIQLLEAAGLCDVVAEVVEWQHTADPEAWWSGPANGIASIGFVVTQQDAATVSRIKGVYDRIVAQHLDDRGQLRLATSAVLASGRVPAGLQRRAGIADVREALVHGLVHAGCPPATAVDLAAALEWDDDGDVEALRWHSSSVGADDTADAVDHLVRGITDENAEAHDRAASGETDIVPMWPLPDRRPRR